MMTFLTTLLLAFTKEQKLLILIAIALFLGIILITIIHLVRKRMFDTPSDGLDMGLGFSMSQLKEMHANEQLTDEEYQHAVEHNARRSREYLEADKEKNK